MTQAYLKHYWGTRGWTVDMAIQRRNNSLQYARDAKKDNWNGSYKVLFVELAWKYHNIAKALRS